MKASSRQGALRGQDIVHANDEKFWLTFNHANVGMALVLPDGHIERANAELCHLLGYADEELAGVALQSITYPGDLSHELNCLSEILEGKSTNCRFEKRFARQDGTLLLASVAVAMDRDQSGQPLQFIYIVTPVHVPEVAAPAPSPTQEMLILESEDRLFQFMEAMPLGVYVIDGDGRPYYANSLGQELLGIGVTPESPDDPMAGVYPVFIAGTDEPYPEEWMPLVRAMIGESTNVDDLEIRTPSRSVPVKSWGAPIYGSKGQILYGVSAFSDLTQRKADYAEIMVANDRYEAICDNVNELISMHDLRGAYRFASRASSALLGYEAHELLGIDARLYIHPEDLPVVGKTFQRYAAGSDEHMRATYRVRRKDGEYIWVETSARPILGTYGLRREILFVTRSVSDEGSLESGETMQARLIDESREQQEREKEREKLALIDSLTGVKIRSATVAHLQQMLTSRRASTYPLGCLLIDVDRFVELADKYGQATSDDILKKIARIITNACRVEDFVGRLGNHEFMVLLPNTDAAGTVVVGEKLISHVRTAYWADSPIVENITISIGGACITRYTGLSDAEMLRMLDEQLSEAQLGGCNRMVMNARSTTSGQWAALSGR